MERNCLYPSYKHHRLHLNLDSAKYAHAIKNYRSAGLRSMIRLKDYYRLYKVYTFRSR